MCEAHAYLRKGSSEEKVLESVDLMEVEGSTVRLVNIFGEQRVLHARFLQYNSREGRLLFEAASEA